MLKAGLMFILAVHIVRAAPSATHLDSQWERYKSAVHVARAAPSATHLDSQWERYKQDFNKTYFEEHEDTFRRSIWMENLNLVSDHNRLADQGLHTYWLKINHFADMTEDELYTMHGLDEEVQLPETKLTFRPSKKTNYGLPQTVDWRDKGYVTPIKFQGHCGSCYAFSATGALEGQHFKKYGKLVSLSEQNIVDCTIPYGNKGCHGGNMNHAFEYVINNGGIDTESSYSYYAQEGTCRFSKNSIGSKEKNFHTIPIGDEQKLQIAVARQGPVSVGIDASDRRFKLYSYGVYNNPACSSTKLDHALLIVGYGVESDGREYWIIKNSWGAWWGNAGYGKLTRNKDNQCGIASMASYPLL